MPSSFPFLRLPILVQLLILKNARLLNLFNFSLLMQRCKQIAKSLDLTVSKLHWCFYNKSRIFLITLYFPDGSELLLYFEQDGSEGSVKLVARERDQFTKHILTLFNVRVFALKYSDPSDIRDCFVWKYTKQFNSLEAQPKMTKDQVEFVLKELEIKEKLCLFSVEKGFSYSGPLNMKRLEVQDAHWIELEAVLNMDCEHLRLLHTSLSYKDLNTIVKKWMNGGMEKLKEIQVMYFNPVPRASRDTKLNWILEGINTFTWDANNRPEMISEFNCKDGRDIRRDDGTIATVNQVRDTFIFHIWNSLSVDQ